MKSQRRSYAPATSSILQCGKKVIYCLVAGSLTLGTVAVQLMGGPTALMGSLAAVAVIVAIWSLQFRPVQLRREHLELRTRSWGELQLIAYDEIECIDDSQPRKVTLRIYRDGQELSVRLPMHLFSPEDGEALLDRVDQLSAA